MHTRYACHGARRELTRSRRRRPSRATPRSETSSPSRHPRRLVSGPPLVIVSGRPPVGGSSRLEAAGFVPFSAAPTCSARTSACPRWRGRRRRDPTARYPRIVSRRAFETATGPWGPLPPRARAYPPHWFPYPIPDAVRAPGPEESMLCACTTALSVSRHAPSPPVSNDTREALFSSRTPTPEKCTGRPARGRARAAEGTPLACTADPRKAKSYHQNQHHTPARPRTERCEPHARDVIATSRGATVSANPSSRRMSKSRFAQSDARMVVSHRRARRV